METVKMDIWAIPSDDSDQGFDLMLMPPKKSWTMGSAEVKIGTTVVQFEPPEEMSREEMTRKAIETLRDKQKQIRAESHREIQKLEEQITNLLMLPHMKAEDDENTIILSEAIK